jgi:nicotinamidase-related amidase
MSILGKSPVLLVIDVQHEFIDTDGAVPCPATSVSGPKEVVQNIFRRVNAAKISNEHTNDIYKGNTQALHDRYGPRT